MPKPRPLTNAEKQAAWRKRRQAKIEALEKEKMSQVVLDALEFKRDALIARLERKRGLSKELRADLELEVREIETELLNLGHPEPHGKRLSELRDTHL